MNVFVCLFVWWNVSCCLWLWAARVMHVVAKMPSANMHTRGLITLHFTQASSLTEAGLKERLRRVELLEILITIQSWYIAILVHTD